MLSIVLLGTGNVAHHLFKAFLNAENAEVVQVFGRTRSHLREFEERTSITTDINTLKQADIYLMAVNDDAITKISKDLASIKGLVAHTSGSVSLNALTNKRKGVFYPLQTFSKERAINFKEVPICLEANSKEDLKILRALAVQVSISVYNINSEKRKSLHLAAVFVNNFTNHFYDIGARICSKENLPFDILRPLIQETVEKVKDLSPSDAQTGPAKRNDIGTMQHHLDLISSPLQKKLYQFISESIRLTNEEKL